jgi:hypothetical protein
MTATAQTLIQPNDDNEMSHLTLDGNYVYQVCGTPLDLDRASHLVITDNMVQEPGWIWDGHPHCRSGHTAHLLDISESLIERNTIHNDCRHTVSYDPNHVFSADGSGTCDTGNMDPDCNLDDDQHNGVGHDAFRNDNCGHYN